MPNLKDLKIIFWSVFFALLFIPLTNSFVVNLKKLVSSITTNSAYKELLSKLNTEKKDLDHKVRYYESKDGLKSLIKDRLNKVEDGELLIRLSERMVE